jgi:RHS repeat-associated protein
VAKTTGAATTAFLVDDRNPTGYAQVVEEIVGGSVQRSYTYGLSRISQRQASGTSFYGYDGHGNVRFLTDATGAVTDRYDYEAFGNIISQAGITSNLYLYSGEQNDANIGSYYLRARYLNQVSGRLWTMDPFPGNIARPSSLTRYPYAANNPVNLNDPSGNITTLDIGALALFSIVYTPAPMPNVNSSLLKGFLTRARELQAACNDPEFYHRQINYTLVLGRGPEGGPKDCHVNLQAEPRFNWHIIYDGSYVVLVPPLEFGITAADAAWEATYQLWSRISTDPADWAILESGLIPPLEAAFERLGDYTQRAQGSP